MTLSSYQRSIVTLISQQEMLGKGMHMNPEEFRAVGLQGNTASPVGRS